MMQAQKQTTNWLLMALVHLAHFFESVRSRKPPVEDALMGHRAASCAHMVNTSMRQNKTIYWDFDRENVKG